MSSHEVDLKKLRTGLGESRKKRLKRRSGDRCIVCGSSEGLEIAHIVPLRFIKQAAGIAAIRTNLSKRFDEDRKDIEAFLNDENNLAVLCGSCHKRFDGREEKGRARQEKLGKFSSK
jgi:5-methylcytosine-specific restriction endonuclease McrA